MDKQTEINTLQSLKDDTYFGMFFNNHDIDQMCVNIKNDFPIEMDCQFHTQIQALEKQISEMEATHKAEIEKLNATHKIEMEEFGKKLIVENEMCVDDIYKTLENQFGKKFIINTKFEAKQELSEDELSYLIEGMNKYNNR